MKAILRIFPVFLALILIGAGCAKTAPEVQEEVVTPEMETITLEDGSYTIDLEKSSVSWKGAKAIGSSHNGTVDLSSGSLRVDGGQVNAGEFVLDMNTITCLDLEGAGAERLEAHLKNADFFDVENHPEASFTITSFEVNGDKAMVTGDLTIKETTESITFEAMLSNEGNVLMADASFSIDRTLWDIQYGSGKFFQNLGDNLINDEMEFTLHLEAMMDSEAEEETESEEETEE